ncbi:MAG: prenyltransferase [Chloroflexota bacterium]
MRRLTAFITLGRPLFLVGGFVMHALGVAMALYSGATLNLAALLWGQIAISATQWMTHYSNDYFDLQADRANRTPTHWSGGSRVLLKGEIPPRAALIMAEAFAAAAVIAGFVLAVFVGTAALTMPLIGLALLLAWFYSAPPLRLHSRGLGELTTAVLVPGLAPLTGFYLQAGRLDVLPLLAILPLCCFQFCMLLAIEFPDAEGDRAAGKRTLVVRLGTQRAARLYCIVLIGAFAALPLLVLAGLPPFVALLVGLTALLALVQLWRVKRGDDQKPERWNSFAFLSIALLFAAALLEVAAFVVLIGI